MGWAGLGMLVVVLRMEIRTGIVVLERITVMARVRGTTLDMDMVEAAGACTMGGIPREGTDILVQDPHMSTMGTLRVV